MSPRLLWPGAVAVAVLGTVLVFASVTVAGLFRPGVVLIDVALLLALAAGVLQLAPLTTTAARAE